MKKLQLAIFTLSFISAPLYGADFFCSDVTCLIAAINEANLSEGPHTIFLEQGVYTLTDFDPDGNLLPSIRREIAIQSYPPNTVTIERPRGDSALHRLFDVSVSGALSVFWLTLQPHEGFGISTHIALNNGRLVFYGTAILGGVNDSPGQIVNNGSILFYQSTIDAVSSFHAGVIYNTGDAEIIGSTVSRGTGNGPIIWNRPAAQLLIRDSSIIHNASSTATISNLGNLTIINTTLANNAGIVGHGDAALENFGGVVSILNSTIAQNRGLGGGILNSSGGTVMLKNSIVALNAPLDCLGEITSQGSNIIGDPTGCTIELLPDDLTGYAGLGEFSDNGDPGNGHFPLLSDSPAIDSADPDACPETDQLGNPRVGICDRGSIEFQGGEGEMLVQNP